MDNSTVKVHIPLTVSCIRCAGWLGVLMAPLLLREATKTSCASGQSVDEISADVKGAVQHSNSVCVSLSLSLTRDAAMSGSGSSSSNNSRASSTGAFGRRSSSLGRGSSGSSNQRVLNQSSSTPR